jgi:glycosyltransferase involved in cell wall biosynthesis
VILEAMAMQLPVVSTAHSGIPEAVEHEITGLLVPPGDVGALSQALARLLDSPATGRQMGLRGRQAVASRFDVEKNVGLLHDRFSPVGAVR